MDEPDSGPHSGPERTESRMWLVTFTDLISLMLAFFVMLFAMSNVKVGEWEKMVDTLSQSLNPSREPTVEMRTAQYNIATMFRKRSVNLDYLTAVLDEAMSKHDLLARARPLRLEDRLIIALPGEILFEPGRAVMTARALEAVFDLGGVLRNVGNQIAVNGHSDPPPPVGDAYASNWELSTARAVAVANALRRSGYPEDIVALGYSDSRYGHLPDLPEARRRAMARRVDIVVYPEVAE